MVTYFWRTFSSSRKRANPHQRTERAEKDTFMGREPIHHSHQFMTKPIENDAIMMIIVQTESSTAQLLVVS
jgi:hypothetical protein